MRTSASMPAYILTLMSSCLVLLTALHLTHAELITSLPGLETLPSFDQYSGYIDLPGSEARPYERHMFYWFAESQRDPAVDPVRSALVLSTATALSHAPRVVWFNGGPGCSSLIGLFTEHGPVRPLPGGMLELNSLSWNLFANMLYIESPIGVGFSFANASLPYSMNDAATASDNFEFLEAWLQEFPAFQSNALHLTGESYAGNYVPQLTALILSHPGSILQKNLKGIMLGNPVLSCPEWTEHERTHMVSIFYHHALIPYSSFKEWQSSGCAEDEQQPHCAVLYDSLQFLMGMHSGDDLYKNWCIGNSTLNFIATTPNCTSPGNLRDAYLNEAIHARNGSWLGCAQPDSLLYNTTFPNMLPYYESFFEMSPPLRVLFYSGDVDLGVVPHEYTQTCLAALNRTSTAKWRKWTVPGVAYDVGAGYVEEFDMYTLCTVRGAGHEAPMYQPYFAVHMAERFLSGENL